MFKSKDEIIAEVKRTDDIMINEIKKMIADTIDMSVERSRKDYVKIYKYKLEPLNDNEIDSIMSELVEYGYNVEGNICDSTDDGELEEYIISWSNDITVPKYTKPDIKKYKLDKNINRFKCIALMIMTAIVIYGMLKIK